MSSPGEKAARAKNLLNDPTYKAIMSGVLDTQVRVFRDPTSSSEERESAHQIVRALEAIENHVRGLVNAASVERHSQEQQHRGKHD